MGGGGVNGLTPWVQFKANLIHDELEVNLTHDGVLFIVNIRFKVNASTLVVTHVNLDTRRPSSREDPDNEMYFLITQHQAPSL